MASISAAGAKQEKAPLHVDAWGGAVTPTSIPDGSQKTTEEGGGA
jgi:hypothetical protein